MDMNNTRLRQMVRSVCVLLSGRLNLTENTVRVCTSYTVDSDREMTIFGLHDTVGLRCNRSDKRGTYHSLQSSRQ